MVHLLLLRHGQSTWNAEGRWQGWADPPLSPLGEAQAVTAARWLADGDRRFSAVACSDLRRARHTAEVVADTLGLAAPLVDEGLRERDIGDWSGFTSVQIEQRWPGMIDAWRSRRIERTPGAEGGAAFVDRIVAAVLRVAAVPLVGGPAIVAITHGGAIRALEHELQAEPGRVSNLCGRWIEVRDGRLGAGPAVVAPGLARPEPLTADVRD